MPRPARIGDYQGPRDRGGGRLAFPAAGVRRLAQLERAARQRANTSALLIDDAPFFRNMLAPILKAAGYRVTAVPSAREGLAEVQSGQRFDVIITDVDMPGMDGFDLASTLRS